MSFKDDILSDLDNVFFNLNEFATEHTFDGKAIVCVLDDDLLEENRLKSSTGIYKGVKMFHVSKNQLEGRPAIGGRFAFDDENYFVSDCKETDGMYTITLSKTKEQ